MTGAASSQISGGMLSSTHRATDGDNTPVRRSSAMVTFEIGPQRRQFR